MAGRPKKLTDAEKRAIIRNFVVEYGTTQLKAYNICALLAKYSNDKMYQGGNGATITASDFRSDLCRREIDLYLSDDTYAKRIDSIPVFVPFDIDKALHTNTKDLEKKLKEREQYYFDQALRAATAIKSYTEQENRYHELLDRYETQRTQMDELQSKLSEAKKQNNLLKSQNKELRKKIKEESTLTDEEMLAFANQKISDTNLVKLVHSDVLAETTSVTSKTNLTVIKPLAFDDLF